MGDLRTSFEWSKGGLDLVNESVKKVVAEIKQLGYKIIICTGRDGCCHNKTADWLIKNDIEFDGLYTRKRGDTRSDYVIKEEIWRYICMKHYIICMLDHRNQVVYHARKLGFKVYQVAEGNF